MIGRDDGTPNLGIIPCAISWLFKLIKKKKDKTWASISVSVSAVEVCGETEVIRDLLSGLEAGDHTPKPNVYLQEDPVCGIQVRLQRQSETQMRQCALKRLLINNVILRQQMTT